MDEFKFLSGNELVARGTTKLDSSLPEVGLKDVQPNGSWLEQKQTQSALEARKHLIEVERIEKTGALSHATWREELMLAEVTQKVGGHWQFLGHNVGKQLFLKPEEALFLMEVNCLKLTYNEVTVSLQQAYSLLLSGKITLMQYRVYASLSRLGYKVFRHEDLRPTEYEQKINLVPLKKNIVARNIAEDTGMELDCENEILLQDETQSPNDGNAEKTDKESQCDVAMMADEKAQEKNDTLSIDKETSESVIISVNLEDDNSQTNELNGESSDIQRSPLGTNDAIKTSSSSAIQNDLEIDGDISTSGNVINSSRIISEKQENITHAEGESNIVKLSKLQILQNRKVKPCDSKEIDKLFQNVSDLHKKQIVTIKTPDEQYIPKNVFLNNISYVLNIENVKANIKNKSKQSDNSRTYSISEEVNGPHVPRVSGSATINSLSNAWNSSFTNNAWNSSFTNIPRPFYFWRPRQQNFGWRPFLPSVFFLPRYHFYHRQPPPLYRPQINSNTNRNTNIPNNNDNFSGRNSDSNKRKRQRSSKKYHFEQIQKLAMRLKHLIQSRNTHSENTVALHRLINTYNTRYGAQLHLSQDFELVNEEVIVDTIELEDENETQNKRPRIEVNDKYEENLDQINQLSAILKDLEAGGKANSRLRRAFSNLVKKFNKSYNADVYVNNSYKVIDRRRIILEDSSDSDCIVDEEQNERNTNHKDVTTIPSGKKLKNPFSILKRLSEKSSIIPVASSSKDETLSVFVINDDEKEKKYSDFILKTFSNNWLPVEEDFGRAEVFPKSLVHNLVTDTKRDEYLFEFIKNQFSEFNNWLDAKISFLRNVEYSTTLIQKEITSQKYLRIDSIIGPEDCTDTASVLNKLRIIKTQEEVDVITNLIIEFDVYNRNVQNFKKSSKPVPHFRVTCVDESANFPTGSEIAALHRKYSDNVPILFAIVGVGSISYLQINPANLPVYILSND